MRQNRKSDIENTLETIHYDSIKDEAYLEHKRREAARSDRARSDRMGGYIDQHPESGGRPSMGSQLISQLADLDVNDPAQVELTDFVKIELELPLWQVLALSRDGECNEQLVGLLNEVLNGEEANDVYMARLNAMILKAASDG